MVKNTKNDTAQERILTAAKKVFLLKGMAGARMQDIADEAGINKALLHYYFRSKEKLFETIFKEASGQFFPKIAHIIDSEIPFFQKIERFCSEYINMMQQNAYLPLFVLNEINQRPEHFLQKVWTGRSKPDPQKFLDQIEREIKKGKIRRVSPLHLLMNLISMTIFPFVSKPMFQRNLGLDDLQFRSVMEQRKKEIPRFIIAAIKK